MNVTRSSVKFSSDLSSSLLQSGGLDIQKAGRKLTSIFSARSTRSLDDVVDIISIQAFDVERFPTRGTDVSFMVASGVAKEVSGRSKRLGSIIEPRGKFFSQRILPTCRLVAVLLRDPGLQARGMATT
jgi:hypothetical protein